MLAKLPPNIPPDGDKDIISLFNHVLNDHSGPYSLHIRYYILFPTVCLFVFAPPPPVARMMTSHACRVCAVNRFRVLAWVIARLRYYKENKVNIEGVYGLLRILVRTPFYKL